MPGDYIPQGPLGARGPEGHVPVHARTPPIDEQVWAQARDVAKEFPTLVDHTKPTADADAFVVALALAQATSLFSRCAVVAHERTKKGKAED